MSEPRPAAPSTPAPVVPRVTRGVRAGEIGTRAAANGAGASASFDAEALTFEFTLLTTRSCKSWRYILEDGARWPEYTQVEEVLDMAGCEGLDELVGSSILNSHRYWDIADVVGVIEAAEVSGDALACRGRLSRRDEVAPIAQDIADGVLRSVSGGFDRIEEALTMRDGQLPLVTITRWRPREASLVPVPADPSARIRSEQTVSHARIVPPPAGQRSQEAAAAVTETETQAVVETAPADEAAALTAAVEAARSALATAEAALAKRSAPAVATATPAAAKADPAVEAQRKADIEGLRFMAQRKGTEVLAEFDLVLRTGGGIAELRTVCTGAIATSGGEISGVVSAARSAPAVGTVPTVLKTRSEYAAARAAGGAR